MVSWAEYGKYASFWDLEAPHVDGDMTGFVCRKQVVLLLVDFAKRAFWRHPRDIQEASERHSIGIFSFIWRQKLRKRRVSWCFFTIKAFFVEWTKREGVFRTKEGSVFRFICQWDSYNLFALFFMTLPKTASDGSKSGSDGCFYSFSDCRKASFSLSTQSIDPTKLRIFFGISSLSLSFFEVKGWERCTLGLLMKVKMQVAVVSEVDVGPFSC